MGRVQGWPTGNVPFIYLTDIFQDTVFLCLRQGTGKTELDQALARGYVTV